MLSATEHGLASIASAVSVAYPQAVRKVLGIPQKFWPVIGIGLGYPDPQAPVNHFRTDRRGMEQIHRLP